MTNICQNRAVFRMPENPAILIHCMLEFRNRGAFLLHEIVVMPNHLHLLLTPGYGTSLEKGMGMIKGGAFPSDSYAT